MRLPRSTLLIAALSLAAQTALAGPVSDFEAALRGVYGTYRVALFATNSGNAAKSAESIATFAAGWAALQTSAPDAPQYQDDAALPETFAAVASFAAKAATATAAGNLPKAHDLLEGVRAEIGALHARNGLSSFSDRMNAYHAMMETVLATDPTKLDAPGMVILTEQAGVLAYLAKQIADRPAPEAADPAYAPLAQTFQDTVAATVSAVRSGDPASIAAALATLKPAYAKFFLKFG